jgi:hypothetical protein
MMKRSYLKRGVVTVAVAVGLCSSARAQKSFDYCADITTQLLKSQAQERELNVSNFVGGISDISCFIQANLADPAANRALQPARASIWNALQSMNSAQQQGSSLSASASTNAVSKPSGPTSLVEEFGGVNTTSGTSSATVQWAPGTMLTNLVYGEVINICRGLTTSGCISSKLIRGLTPLTFKVTANTSGPSPAVNGTSSGSGSSAAQPVTATSATASKPGFSGLTVQYSIYGSKAKAASSALAKDAQSAGAAGATTPAASTIPAAVMASYTKELEAANGAVNGLASCPVFKSWQQPAKDHLNSALTDASNSQAKTEAVIESAYQELFKSMLSAPDCKSAIAMVQGLYAAVLEAKAYEDFGSSSTTSDKPEFGLEYDLNTPQTSPSSSSIKLSGNWQFGGKSEATAKTKTRKAAAEVGTTAAVAGNTTTQVGKATAAETGLHTFASQQAQKLLSLTISPDNATTIGMTPVIGPPSLSSAKQTAAAAKQAAGTSTPPWSITTTGTVEFYNEQPPSTVPSGSHWKDFQLGAEIAYLFAPGSNAGPLRKLIGDVTASGAYSYQDQMSPALLTGPALSDFTGLPSSTTTAYAQRGVIHLGQAKLGFGTGTNMTFPLVFTYSNRSELVVHPTLGLQFGISYNFTSLLSSFGGGNSNSTAAQSGGIGAQPATQVKAK